MKNELLESLKRTDAYINNADLKASFSLAAGITFFGIISSVFFSISSNIDIDTKILISSIFGISIIIWVVWAIKIFSVFFPNIKKSHNKSLFSFASSTQQNSSYDEFINNTKSLSNDDLENDLKETLWICSNICIDKMEKFKQSIFWLSLSLCSSVLAIATIAFIIEFKKLLTA